VPLSAPERSYKDRRPKPELIVALTPFSALSGFRRPATTQKLFRELALPALDPFLAPLADPNPQIALSATFQGLLTTSPEVQRALATATLEAATRHGNTQSEFTKELAWAVRLGALYPGDIGIIGALLLNLVELAPYQGMFLPAGNLHAYLEGAGIEIMAASDNVLRGGLTPKPVNVPELLRVLDFSELTPGALHPELHPNGEHVYPTPSEEFRLSYLRIADCAALTPRKSPEILLVTDGQLSLESSTGALALSPGDSAFIPACEPAYVLRGQGTTFRATAGTPTP